MKILLYDGGSMSQSDLQDGLRHILPETDIISCSLKWKSYDNDPDFEEALEDLIRKEGIHACISFNYFPIIAKVCHISDTLYISWIYDCPHNTLYSDTLGFDTNLIFSFDRMQIEEFQARGVSNICHLPLAVNVSRLDAMRLQVSNELLAQNFAAQIAFLGSMYDDNFYQQIRYLPPDVKGYLDGLCEAQLQLPTLDVLESALSDEVMQKLQEYVNLEIDDGYSMTYRELFCDNFLRKNISYLERSRALESLAKHYQTVLYSNSSWRGEDVEYRGYLNYRTQMPLAFMTAELNLNITIRSIRSGIPLRCLDIMGAGGALISNVQPELEEYFIEGEEWIGFSSLEELVCKTEYYLCHEEERKRIAERGYQRVKESFRYEHALGKLLETAGKYLS